MADSGTVTEAGVAATWTVSPLSVEAARAATLVTLRVRNRTSAPRRVRVTNRLDGPLLPPRRRGVPAAGWADDGYAGVVDVEETLALGYACLAAPPAADPSAPSPPVSLSSTPSRDGASEPTPEDAIRTLGGAAPPSDVVSATAGPGAATSGIRNGADSGSTPESPAASTDDPATGRADSVPPAGSDSRPAAEALPDAVDAWFEEAARRVDRAERLDGASVAEATAVLADVGGVAGAERLGERLDADAAVLARVAREATRLAARADDADVPTEALRRLS